VGVHLNLTFGRPLTEQMRRRLSRWRGDFPSDYSIILVGILTRRLPMECILEEWRAQIQRCKDADIEIRFLNTHEHLHALPSLFAAILKLAEENDVPYIRCPEPEWDGWKGLEVLTRNTLLQIMHLINHAKIPKGTPKLLGMNESGKLTLLYLKRRLISLQKGQVYELMCHPGYFDPKEIGEWRLCSYHHWQQELDLLRSKEVRNLCDSLGIKVIRYRDLYEKKIRKH
jgi:predicted glycoside hydrolase/deacetylase ChbG (UPF0249 family)